MHSLGAEILSLEEFSMRRATLTNVVAVSGGYDPIHPGHISNFVEAKKLGDILVVAVNGDSFLTRKKGRPFQDLRTRSLIISALRCVDYVVPFEADDQTACLALEAIRPDIFANGGDRKDPASIPEWEVCQKHNIKMVFNVGTGKEGGWSSSWFLAEWEDFMRKHQEGVKGL